MDRNKKRPDNEAPINESAEVGSLEKAAQEGGNKGSFRASFQTRAFRAGSYSFVVSVIVLAIVVIINILAKQLPNKFTSLDLTTKSYFTLSEQTQQLISGLKDDVNIYWLVETGTEDTYLEQLLNRYNDMSDRISVEKIDFVVFPSFATAYTDAAITNNSVIIVRGDNSRYIDNSDIYLEETSANVGFTTLDFNAENALTSALVKITSGDALNIYELTGHGETGLAEYSQKLASAVTNENYVLQSINLSKYEKVPDDCASLMLISPKTDLSSQEVDKIIDYLTNGGKMTIVTDLMKGETPNFDNLLAHYGVELVDGIIVENDTDYYNSQSPFFLMPKMSTHVITNPLIDAGYSVILPGGQGIGFLGDVRAGVYYGKFLNTSDSSFSKQSGKDSTTTVWEEGDIMGPFTIGCTITETVNDKTCRISLFTTTTLLNDDANQMVSGANFDLFVNTVNWCCDRENNISIRPKNMNIKPLTFSGTETNRMFLFMVIAIPVVPLIIAVAVTSKRRRR